MSSVFSMNRNIVKIRSYSKSFRNYSDERQLILSFLMKFISAKEKS